MCKTSLEKRKKKFLKANSECKSEEINLVDVQKQSHEGVL